MLKHIGILVAMYSYRCVKFIFKFPFVGVFYVDGDV